ncbi:hypothetical protein O2N63_03915 [Aliiroseovarius sp. KMU-50]|uniref:Uncharacterized protein n=1 Tax=Aliiroseovarius salicola TaxID=3009082 RepID=A0ABT4VY84_9RHOB|nr:hypothetical protein [Aliiroseovarius sp. KMU-50]MDA5093226.1 hypothetical protein [Aliiroseovarius sp. KMU-50]
MPSRKAKPEKRKLRVCLYGDSNLAALRLAFNEGYDPGDDVEVSFFGAQGPAFRQLRQTKDGVQADKKLINGKELISTDGRSGIKPSDFDAILFIGARLRAHEYFHAVMPGLFHRDRSLSLAVREAMTAKFLSSCRSVRIATLFSSNGMPFVAFAPSGFLNEGLSKSHRWEELAGIEIAKQTDRAAIWSVLEEELSKRGVTLIAQPEETVASGCLTKAQYAVDDAKALGDAVHKNEAYGKIILDHFFGSKEFAALRVPVRESELS